MPEVWFNLGHVYRLLLRLDDAAAAFERAISLRPDFAMARWDRSLTHLLAGNYLRGWEDFDSRFQLPAKRPIHFVVPAWNGSLEELRGKTILLAAEQGFGDTIQFARYVPILADAGARVVLICQPELVSLMTGVRGLAAVASPPVQVPPHDLCAPLMSLGKLLRTTPETVPADVPYLHVQRSDRLASFAGTRKVGLVWAGRPTHPNDVKRSIPLTELSPLIETPGITWVSLQKGPASEQLRSSPFGSTMVDAGASLGDFADTARLISELDLVISVDTGVVHLAGALGKPVWTLLPYNPDWRWMLNRDDSPWYPTMRLFRQQNRGDWSGVIENVRSQI
jgi:hypothetical protein